MARVTLGYIHKSGGFLRSPKKMIFEGSDLLNHVWMPGLTGAGKSTLMLSWVLQLWRQRSGVTVVDPSGNLAEQLLSHVVSTGFYKTNPNAYNEVLWIQPSSEPPYFPLDPLTQPFLNEDDMIRFNLEAMYRIWPKLAEHASLFGRVAQHSFKLLLDNDIPFTKMPFIYNLRNDDPKWKTLIANIKDEYTRDFWSKVWTHASDHDKLTYLGSAPTRFDNLVLSRAFRHSFSQKGRNVINPREAMDKRKLVIIDLSRLDIETMQLVGSMITHGYEVAAHSRAPRLDLPEHYLFVDEVSQFIRHSTQSLSDVLARTRQWGLFTILAHQTLSQAERSREFVGALQNSGLRVVFRMGADDAHGDVAKTLGDYDHEMIRKEAVTPTGQPILASSTDQYTKIADYIKKLPNYHALVRLTVNDTVEIETLPVPTPTASRQAIQEVKEEYLKRYATPPELLDLDGPSFGSSSLPPPPPRNSRLEE